MLKIKKFIPSLFWHIVVLLLAFLMAFPFLWLIFSSFKGAGDLFTQEFSFFPKEFHFENYGSAWSSAPWGQFFINSFIVSIGVVLTQLITCSLAGYALATIDFKGKRLLFILILGSTMIPFESTMIPSYLLMTRLDLMNSYLGLILPSATGVFGIFLMRQQFMTMPRELLEAAQMDGSSTLRTFFKIALPLAKPALATVSLFAFLNAWNGYIWPLLITTETEMRTVQIGLRYMIDGDRGIQWPELLAASSFVIIPILILFMMLQKYFIQGVMHTGSK